MIQSKQTTEKELNKLRDYVDRVSINWDVRTKQGLRLLMNRAGIKTTTKVLERDKQLKVVWKHLKDEGKIKALTVIYNKTQWGFRLTENKKMIDGKIYRKGQFIPKRKY